MADGVTFQSATPATPSAGLVVATDDAGASGHVPLSKLAISTDGSATLIPADATNGLDVDVTRIAAGTNIIGKVRLVDADGDEISVVGGVLQTSTGGASGATRIQVTPTISTTIYAANDCIGGLMTFANAAASSGGSCRIEALQIVDKAQQLVEMELVLFDRTITATTDNAAFDPTDTECSYVVGRVPISSGHYGSFVDNSVATVPNLGLVAELNGTDLFGQLVSRGTPTYVGTSDIVVSLTVTRLD